MRRIRVCASLLTLATMAAGLAAPAAAVTPPFPTNWTCEAPPAGVAWQVWHCKVAVRVEAGRRPDRPLWATKVARAKAQAQATAAGIGAEIGIAGCRFHRLNKWNCIVLVNTPYVP